MSVHMFRVLVGRGPMTVAELETRINDWVGSNAEWESDPVDHSLVERNTRMDGSGVAYYGVSVRFELSDAKSNLLQKFMDKLENKVAWVRVGYHECTHSEDSPSGCGWSDSVEWTANDTAIPTGIPLFEVQA